MHKIEGVIFDWAGTTVDFGCMSPVSAFRAAFETAGLSPTEAEIRAPMGQLKRDHIRTMLAMPRLKEAWTKLHGKAPDDEAVEEIYGAFEPGLMGVLRDHCDLKPGLLETVQWLRERGIRIGSTTGFTSGMMEIVREEAKKAGYAPDALATADDAGGFGRPWPYMIQRNMRLLNLGDVRGILKVGDTVSDIREAKHAGVRSVSVVEGSSVMGLSRGDWEKLDEAEKAKARERARQVFVDEGTDFVIENLSELPALIRMLSA